VQKRLQGTLILHFAAGEECGEPGTLSLIERGYVGDFGITTEPTDLAVAVAMRGSAWYRVTLHGASSHAAAPWAGQNPIMALAVVLEALHDYDKEIQARTHPLVGSAACSPTIIRSGVEHNAIPDTCEVVLDRRLIPGETPENALLEIRQVILDATASRPGVSSTVTPLHRAFTPAEIATSSSFVELAKRSVEMVTQSPARIEGTPYGSDVRNLVNDAGMDAITFGAGSVSGCHCANERQVVDDVKTAALVIVLVALELLTSIELLGEE
jgi:succinyl-diaminopimelate desuccinylase